MKISAKQNVKTFLLIDAILLALLAQQFLIRDQFTVAIILFLIAIGISIFAVTSSAKFKNDETEVLTNLPLFKSRLGWILAGWAIILAGFTFFLYESSVPAFLPWTIHLISVLLFLAAVLDFHLPSKENLRVWLKKDYISRILLLTIIIIGGLIRFSQLDVVPFGTWYDEADFGLNALSLIEKPDIRPVFFESSRVPAYFIYLCAAAFKLFGVSTTSLRLVSAFFGTLTIVLAYWFGKEAFNQKSGLVFAALIAFSRWHINWSRIGLDNITVPFFEILVMLLLFMAFRKRNHGVFALAGITFGLGLSFYASMRIFPAVIGLWLLLKWINEKNFIQKYWRGGIIFIIAAVITMIPITQYAVFHPDRFWDRVKETSIFQGKTNQEAWKAVQETTQEHLLMFNFQGDQNGRHNLPKEPMLDPISAGLMVLGLGICISRINKPRYFLLIMWWLLMLAPGIFSLDFESPQSLRAIGSLPAAFLLALVPIDELLIKTNTISKKWITYGIYSITFIGMIIIGVNNTNFYFNRQMRASSVWLEFSTQETIVAKEMNRIGPANYYVSTFLYNTPTLRFIAPQVTEYTRLETYDQVPLKSQNNLDNVIFIDTDREPFYNLLQNYFPNAKFKKIFDPNGNLILYEIQISAENIRAQQGLIASYYPDGDLTKPAALTQKENNFLFYWEDQNQFPQPYQIVWDGVILIEKFGEHLFFNTQPEITQLWIDETLIPWNQAVLLAKGNHHIKIQAASGEGLFSITWQQPEDDRRLLTAANLFIPPISANGLLGEYTSGTDWSGPVKYAQIDPTINFYYHNQPIARPYTVKWHGRILIEQAGNYLFRLDSRDESRLFIDDQLVIDNDPAGTDPRGSIPLEAGPHTIRIDYTDASGYSHISLYWTPPDDDETLIPANVLVYP